MLSNSQIIHSVVDIFGAGETLLCIAPELVILRRMDTVFSLQLIACDFVQDLTPSLLVYSGACCT